MKNSLSKRVKFCKTTPKIWHVDFELSSVELHKRVRFPFSWSGSRAVFNLSGMVCYTRYSFTLSEMLYTIFYSFWDWTFLTFIWRELCWIQTLLQWNVWFFPDIVFFTIPRGEFAEYVVRVRYGNVKFCSKSFCCD